jgi:hypothetical protein
MADKKHTHPEVADRILKALPKGVRDNAELKAGGGEYTILRVNGKSVASVRDNAVRIVHPHDSSAAAAKALAALIADAAPKPEPKAKAEKPKADDESAETEGDDGSQ